MMVMEIECDAIAVHDVLLSNKVNEVINITKEKIVMLSHCIWPLFANITLPMVFIGAVNSARSKNAGIINVKST